MTAASPCSKAVWISSWVGMRKFMGRIINGTAPIWQLLWDLSSYLQSCIYRAANAMRCMQKGAIMQLGNIFSDLRCARCKDFIAMPASYRDGEWYHQR